jgi:hypothetical protein
MTTRIRVEAPMGFMEWLDAAPLGVLLVFFGSVAAVSVAYRRAKDRREKEEFERARPRRPTGLYGETYRMPRYAGGERRASAVDYGTMTQ